METKTPTFGERLRAARERFGLTQVELARECGVSYQRIGALERGVDDNPGLDTIKRLSSALGLTVTQLLDGRFPRKSTAQV